jgi:hypothetical protein
MQERDVSGDHMWSSRLMNGSKLICFGIGGPANSNVERAKVSMKSSSCLSAVSAENSKVMRIVVVGLRAIGCRRCEYALAEVQGVQAVVGRLESPD